MKSIHFSIHFYFPVGRHFFNHYALSTKTLTSALTPLRSRVRESDLLACTRQIIEAEFANTIRINLTVLKLSAQKRTTTRRPSPGVTQANHLLPDTQPDIVPM